MEIIEFSICKKEEHHILEMHFLVSCRLETAKRFQQSGGTERYTY